MKDFFGEPSEILEQNNSMIATFTGGGRTKDVVEHYDYRWVRHISTGYVNSGIEQIKDLKYHLSWDWLMPIVEKIRATKYLSTTHEVIIKNKITSIYDEDELICEYEGENSLQNTYNCVVEFIKWIN